MPLKLKLAAHERLIVNGAVMVNGGCRTTLVIGNFAHIMREKDVLQERDANTPTKRLYLILQTMLMQPPPSEAVTASYRLAHSQLTAAYERPENLTILAEVDRMVDAGDFYKAMMKLQPLIGYEAQLLNVPPQEWRRASQREPETTRLPGEPQPGSVAARYPASTRAPNTGRGGGYAVAAQ
jgi:flagellar biosynthesis repressor protein FlbT